MKHFLIVLAVALAGALVAFALRKTGTPAGIGDQSELGEDSAGGELPLQRDRAEAASATEQPTFTRVTAGKVAQDDPRAADYDALRLSQMVSVSSFEVFEREPRNDPWASGMEQVLDEILVDALAADFEGAEVASVECRTQSCMVSLAVDDARAGSLYGYAQAYLLLGSSMSSRLGETAEGLREMQFAVLFDKRFGDADGFRDWRERVVQAQEAQREQLRRELSGIAEEE